MRTSLTLLQRNGPASTLVPLPAGVLQAYQTDYRDDKKDEVWGMMGKPKVDMKGSGKYPVGKALLKEAMQTWLTAGSAILQMISFCLPSPAKAQEYRVENFYDGPLDDLYPTAIRD